MHGYGSTQALWQGIATHGSLCTQCGYYSKLPCARVPLELISAKSSRPLSLGAPTLRSPSMMPVWGGVGGGWE